VLPPLFFLHFHVGQNFKAAFAVNRDGFFIFFLHLLLRLAEIDYRIATEFCNGGVIHVHFLCKKVYNVRRTESTLTSTHRRSGSALHAVNVSRTGVGSDSV
jgi:hypothetical protein